MVYAVCVVFISYQIRKEVVMKNVIKNIVITFVIIATAIVVADWTLSQLEEGYTSSYPSKLDK